MALVAWYPLDKDLKNYGVSENGTDLDSTGVTTNDNGKLGKCFYFQKQNSLQNKIYFKELDGAKIFSFGCWINFDKDNVDWAKAIFLETSSDNEDDNTIHNGIRFECAYASTENSQFGVYDYPSYHHIMKGNNIGAKNTITPPNEWHHFMFVANGKNCYFYKDGIIIGNCEQEQTGYLTGNFWAGGQNNPDFPCHCYMNDLRIYNHALSQSEVQEIYRSLILKYSFDKPIENPVISEVNITNLTGCLNGGNNQCRIIGKIPYNKDYLISDKYLTISFDLTINDLLSVEGEESLGAITLQEHSIINGVDKWSSLINSDRELDGRVSKIAEFSDRRQINLTTNGTYHISRTYKILNGEQYSNVINVELRFDYIVGGTASVSNFKVVLGKKEILSDGTDGVLYDESGFGHSAKVISSTNFLPALYYSTESKIGEGCYQSMTKTDSGDETYGVVQTLDIFNEIPEISIAFWLYVPETDNNTGDNTILGYSANAENYAIWIRRNDLTLCLTLYHVTVSLSNLQRNMWHYIVVTAQKQGDFKVYLNGELKSSKSNISGTDWENAYLTIGDLRNGRGLDLDGKIDDLKIYATILDEEYIKKEYKERTKIDNNGNIYCNELIEINDDNNIFSFNNITNYRELPNIEESFFDKNSLLITSTEGTESARYFRVRMKFSAGTYKVFRTYNIIGDNYTNTTGRFHISKIDWSQNFIELYPNDYYGTITFTEDTDVYVTFVASENDSNTDKIVVQYSLYIYPDENQEIQETKILGNGQVEGYNLKEEDEKLTKIYNKQRTIQTETLYEY